MPTGLLILSRPTLQKALPFSRYYTTPSGGQCWCTHGLWTSYWCQKGRRGWEGYRHLPVNNICLEDRWPQQKERNLPCNVWTGSCCMCIGLKLSLSYGNGDAFFFQPSTRKKRTMATHLERSGRHLWMNLKMEMALWFPASPGIVTNLEVSPSKKTCAFGEGYGDCRLQIGASSCGSSYQFIVIVQSPLDQYSPLSTCCIFSGTMVSGIPSLEHATASPQHHSWIIPPPSSFTGCHQGACSGNSSRSQHQAMSLRPWYPPWRAPKIRQLRGDKKRAAGFDAWAVLWWCDEGI